jgi:predicted RND superfamily exporter protein
MGISESINVVIIIGLSVDYCVHLATDYQHQFHVFRKQKMRQTYKNMGVSILSGTITTLGSGAFLYGGELMMFKKFSIIICSTILLSYLVSMLLFGALMHILGPENGCGDLFYSCRE